MSIKLSVIEKFHTHNPINLRQMKKLGFKIEYIDSGAFRSVYHIVGTQMVVKIPKGSSGIYHARAEYETIDKINRTKKLAKLRKYIPEVYYYNHDTGIVLMRKYKELRNCKYSYMISKVLKDLVETIFPYAKSNSTDLHYQNMGYYVEDSGIECPVIIDLGYFSDLGKGWGYY